MIISHEVPLCLLDKSRKFNDYDYCLPCFMEKHESYKEYFLKAKEDKRFIIMDNSLFEGYTHTDLELINAINLITPDIFIIPDSWNNYLVTANNARVWNNHCKNMLPEKTQLMVVLQGTNLKDLCGLYTYCESLGITHFAINHSSAHYLHNSEHPNDLVKQMMGRIELVTHLKQFGFIKENHYIHLLGCSLPQEFIYYKDPYFDFINSVDTSSPILNALSNIPYERYGLLSKPKEKLEHFMLLENLTDSQERLLDYNIWEFKNFIKQNPVAPK